MKRKNKRTAQGKTPGKGQAGRKNTGRSAARPQPLTPEEAILQRRRRIADREEIVSFLTRLEGLAALLWVVLGLVLAWSASRLANSWKSPIRMRVSLLTSRYRARSSVVT